MEDVYTTEGKITTTTEFSTTETNSSKLPTLSITGRIGKLGQHLYIIQTTYTQNNPTPEKRTFYQWYVTIQQMHQEKPLTLLRGCPQMAQKNSNDQRCKGQAVGVRRTQHRGLTEPTLQHFRKLGKA